MTTGKRYDFLLKQMKDRESGVESLESTSKDPGAEGKEETNLESRVEKVEINNLESRVAKDDSIVESLEFASQESRIEKEESLGLESRVKTDESRAETPEHASQEPMVERKEAVSLESRVESLDYGALDEAIEEARKKPKLGVYSPVVAAMLRYKAITTPRYSMGSEIKTIVEQALKGAYPELYEEVQKRMKTIV